MAQQRYALASLRSWAGQVLARCGLPEGDAGVAASVLLRSDARGFRTHGLARLRSYVDKIMRGEVDPRPHFKSTVREGVLYCDCGGGLGQVFGPQATALAISMARDAAFVPCFLKDIGHLGALGLFALQAAEAGLVGFYVQASAPSMALPGARRKAIGNSPLAFAFPRKCSDPFVFDMATSQVSRGHVLLAARESLPIQPGWAIDSDGRPTTDARAALEGAMLPLGGHKGIGLSMMIECLSASLTGAVAAPMVEPDGRSGSASMRVGAFFFLANPDRIVGREAFDEHVAGWVGRYLEASAKGSPIPGERAAAREREAVSNGVTLPSAIEEELCAVGWDCDVPFGGVETVPA